MGPAARQLVEEHGLNPSTISGSGKGGRINKEDVLEHLAAKTAAAAPAPAPASVSSAASTQAACYRVKRSSRPDK
jgi:2-oxoglutarate dehydrogenase E2 component (dihydrolipoamide succinyltransferase)